MPPLIYCEPYGLWATHSAVCFSSSLAFPPFSILQLFTAELPAPPSGTMADDNADYGKKSYWDARYATEGHYDWFASVYPHCVALALECVERVYERQRAHRAPGEPLTVLHLGTGNSALCADLHKAYCAKYPDERARPYALRQVATDYSGVVIDRMRETYAAVPGIVWEVADIRDLAATRRAHGPAFDLIIDKGTMDALQASDSADKDDDVAAMLREVSRCLEGGGRYREFLQITWEIPYKRLALTTGAGPGAFAWGDAVTCAYLSGSDMYRSFVYTVPGEE